MGKFKNDVQSILSTWCERMLSYQIHSDNKRLNGALICPSCGKIHGRCFEAMYPFMEMAALTGDEKWIRASEDLFSWSENTVSLPSGGYINDIDSEWEGISVFACIAMLDTLTCYGSLMENKFHNALECRTKAVAEYLYRNELLKKKNTNYPVSAALALYKAGIYFNEPRFIEKSAEYEEIIYSVFTPSFTVFGEGCERNMRSRRNLLAVDIGYNAEETLPAIASLGLLKNDRKLIDSAVRGFQSILDFLLSDGGWDNSFGTRNFKWTYWGSRTSDGAAEALLALSGYDRSFKVAAIRNIELMAECTYDGLLAGGPDYEKAGQSPCIHHSFTHGKVLAGILFKGLADNAEDQPLVLPRYAVRGLRYKEDIDSYLYSSETYSATVTAYDWPYLKGGHISGGMLSLLEFKGYGPVIVSSMGRYSLKEKHNMQIPYGTLRHECLDFRICHAENGNTYSSIFDDSARMIRINDNSIKSSGHLSTEDGEISIPYSVEYSFMGDSVQIRSETSGTLIIPFVSSSEAISENRIVLEKNDVSIYIDIKKGRLSMPYGSERIYNLVPGFIAVRTEINPSDGVIELEIGRLS